MKGKKSYITVRNHKGSKPLKGICRTIGNVDQKKKHLTLQEIEEKHRAAGQLSESISKSGLIKHDQSVPPVAVPPQKKQGSHSLSALHNFRSSLR